MIAVARARWRRMSSPARGAIWMIAAGICFTSMLGVVKPASENLHAFEIAFFRHFITLFLMIPVFARTGLPRPQDRNLPIIGFRALLGFLSSVCWFYGVPQIPLADSTAINFTSPLWATLFAALILGEQVRLRRWTATAIGFAGVLVVLRPGFSEIPIHAFVVLAGAACWGTQHIVLRRLSQREPVNVILTYHAVFLSAMALVPAVFVWVTPSAADMAWLVVLGIFGTLGHLCLARSFAAAEASVVLPYDYTKMPIAAAIGYFAYGEQPDAMTWAGAAMILAASVYTARREHQIARAERALRTGPPGTA